MLLHDVADQQETSLRVLGFVEEMVFKKEMVDHLIVSAVSAVFPYLIITNKLQNTTWWIVSAKGVHPPNPLCRKSFCKKTLTEMGLP